MNNQDKINRLIVYANNLRDRIKSPAPVTGNKATRKTLEFLVRDLEKTERTISNLKLALPADLNSRK